MSFATLEGVPVAEATLLVPLVGCWVLDCRLTGDAMKVADHDAVSATFGDLVLSGTVFRAGNFTGSGSLRVVGGRGGWRREIPPRYYYVPFGLQAADIVADAARECGEEMAGRASGRPGVRWARRRAPACAVLRLLCPLWWVGFDGRTTPSARPSGVVAPQLNVLSDSVDLADGRVVCAPEDLSDVLPGRTFATPTVSQRTITEVVHRLDPGKDRVRTELWTR